MTISTDIAQCNANSAVKDVLTELYNSSFSPLTPTAGNIPIGSGSAWVSTAISGDITIDSSGVTAIGNNKVTYAKMQAVSTTSRLLGSSFTTTAVQEISLGSGISLSGTTLSATGTGGTVTSFSAGILSPLFTTSVATATTTPALSFSLSNAGANTYFGNATSSTAAPSFTAAGALTKTDDTNVTLTLGGAPTTALLTAASITAGWTGTLAATRGGTGQGTYALGDTLYSSATNTLSKLSGNTTTTRKFFRQTGDGAASAAPAWDTIVAADIPGSALTRTNDTNVTLTLGGSASTALLNAASLTLGWTGTLGTARGGTNADSSAWAQGDLPYISATGTWSHLAKDTNSTRYLSNTGTTNNPAWAQIDLTNGVTGVLPNGNTTATSANTASTIVARDASGNFSVGTVTAALTGNASTATALQNARTIGGVSFDGTANIVPQTIQSVNEASDTTCFPLFISASGTQSLQPLNNTSFRFNASTGLLTVNLLTLDNGAAALSSTNVAFSFTSALSDGNYINIGAGGRNIGVFTGGNFFLTANADYDATNNVYKYNATGAASAIELSSSSIDLKYVASGTAGNTATMSNGLSVTVAGNVIVGSGALATNATNGFLYIESCAGTPTGVPTTVTGRVATVYDTTNNKFYVYNGSWRGVTLA